MAVNHSTLWSKTRLFFFQGVDRQTYVATAHILFHNKEDYTNMAENVKSYLDNQRIYAATVLPESLQVSFRY